MLLLLPGIHLVLLLLVFLVQPCVSRIWRVGTRHRGNVLRVKRRVPRPRNIVTRLVGATCFSCRYCRVERARPRRCRDRRTTLVHRSAQAPIGKGRLDLVLLNTGCDNVTLAIGILFFAVRSRFNSTCPSVVADVVNRPAVVINDRRVVYVANVGDVHIGDGTVVVKPVMVPASTFKATAEIPETIVDPAIKADGRTPVTFMEDKRTAFPSPPRGCPEIARLRSQHPCARDPVVPVRTPCPVAGRPDVAITGAHRLFIDWQRRWSKTYRDKHAGKRCRRHHQNCEHNDQPTKSTEATHSCSSCPNPVASR